MHGDVATLEAWFCRAGRVLVGYSGGVDSALLAVVGTRVLGSSCLAVIGRSASYPEAQWRQATAVARQHGVMLLEVGTGELDDPEYRRNDTNRCFHCKRELWHHLTRIASERGIPVVVDGTNADDVGEHRPGLAAGHAFSIRSPLLELGWRKADVRAAARSLGLAIWDAPAAPCLASRLRYGLPVTPERLGQVEAAEASLRALGVTGDLRVRHLGNAARIEVAPGMLDLVRRCWARVVAELQAVGFARVELDPRGYRRGSLLAG